MQENHRGEKASKKKISQSRDHDKICPICEKHFKYDWSYKMHKQSFHTENEVMAAQELEKLTTGSSKLRCPTCDEVFSQRSNLKRHLISNNPDPKKFECEQCGRFFNRRDNLDKHQQRQHKMVNINVELLKKSYGTNNQCKMCGAIFENQIALVQHLVNKFCQKPQLENVVEISSNQTFGCDQCEKAYLDADSLSRHKRWKHTEPIREFICSDCGCSLKLKSSLVRHTRKKHPVEESRFSPYCFDLWK